MNKGVEAAPALLLLCIFTTGMTSHYSTLLRQTSTKQQAETPAEYKTHKQQLAEHNPCCEQEQTVCSASLCVAREQTLFSDSTRPSRSEIREGTDEANLTKVIKLKTDMGEEELVRDTGCGENYL